MVDSTNTVINIMTGLKSSDGSRPSKFRDWSENTAVISMSNRPDVALVLKEESKPTAGYP